MKDSGTQARRIMPYLLLPLLLLLPMIAVVGVLRHVHIAIVTGYFIIISSLTMYAYWSDKRKAKLDSWRIPESRLHLLELFGGWPVAYLSQRVFRHKVAKKEYQFVFWIIVALHQYVALDYLLEWKCVRMIYQLVKGIGG